MMDKLGLSIKKVSEPKLTTINITEDSTVTKLVNYLELDHCEGGANDKVVDCFEYSSTSSSTLFATTKRAAEHMRCCKAFSLIANDWKEDKVTVNTPEFSGLPEIIQAYISS
jgi:hypothetical protein